MVARIVGERPDRAFSLSEDVQSDTTSRKYLVRTTKRTDDVDQVYAAPGLPKRGYLHPRIADMWVTGVSGTQDPRAWYRWEVDVTYSRVKPDERDEQGKPDSKKLDNPLLREPDVSGRFAEFQFVSSSSSITDYAGRVVGVGGAGAVPFTASSGELYDPPPEQTGYFILTTIRRNEERKQIKLWKEFVGAVNEDVVSTYKKGTVAILGIAWSGWRYENGKRFTEVTYELGIKDNTDPWQLKLLDHGTYYLDTGNKKPFKDAEGNPRLGLLDGSGGALADGSPAVYRTFVVRASKSFARLKLPSFDR